jgi:hypothetical protein
VPLFHGTLANTIALASVHKVPKHMPTVPYSMPRLDAICRLASSMVVMDRATRHVAEAWDNLLAAQKGSACAHSNVHVFPRMPLVVDGAVLFNFPTLECCTGCGYVTAAYPGVPHPMRFSGYGKLRKAGL